MKSVLVTGASGFIGKNLCATLEQDQGIELLKHKREDAPEHLRACLEKAEFVFHLAGVNRPRDESEYDEGNRGLTEALLEMMARDGRKASLVFASSTQAVLDNAYGRSKRAAEELVFSWAEETGNSAYVYRLPNVFGKWSRPNYNTVVATFCQNISRGLPIRIDDPAAELTLVYVDDVVAEFCAAMNGSPNIDADGFGRIGRSFEISLQELADKIHALAGIRSSLVVPQLGDLERFLYATLTSFYDREMLGYDLEMRHDDRGWLAEFIKSGGFGQIFISRTRPGITRGNHWHHTKIEKFLVIEGEAEICFRKVDTEAVTRYTVSGKQLKVVDIPAGYTHSITNIGTTDLLTLFWADEIFDREHPDTFFLEV